MHLLKTVFPAQMLSLLLSEAVRRTSHGPRRRSHLSTLLSVTPRPPRFCVPSSLPSHPCPFPASSHFIPHCRQHAVNIATSFVLYASLIHSCYSSGYLGPNMGRLGGLLSFSLQSDVCLVFVLNRHQPFLLSCDSEQLRVFYKCS